MLTRRTSPDGSRTWAYSPSLASSWADVPAERTIWPPLPGIELDVVDRRAERDVGDRQGVADPRLGVRPGDDDVTDLEAVGQEHVALLAVAVVEQADPRRPVRVVLDRREAGRHAELVALEVDPAVVLLLAAAAMADGQPARRCSGRSRGSAARAAACTARSVVISSKVERVICRRPGEVAL